jgi:hypothetical protein
MAIDDDCQAAEFRKKFDAMVAVTTDVKKRYDATYTWILAVTILLEEEQCMAVILAEEAHATAVLIKPPSPMSPSALAGGAILSDDDYEAVVIANVHV